MQKCKITVLKREFYPDLAKEYIPFPDFGPCEMMKEGDVFITTGPFGNECPKGFCAMAKAGRLSAGHDAGRRRQGVRA